MSLKHLELARDKLNPNQWQESGLPGRESQLETIYNFLYNRLKVRTTKAEKRARIESGKVAKITGRHGGKTMFICGVPGTGKTASIMAIIEKLNLELEKKSPSINPFISVYINAQRILTPAAIYSEIYRHLFKKNCSNPEKAQEELEQIFRPEHRENSKQLGSKKKLIDIFKLIIVDELDLLYSDRREDVFYNLFDWPTAADSNMIFIAIANSMDLPERMQGKVSSRIGWEKLVFEPYKSENLETILRVRLGDELLRKCFDRASIAIATKRVGRTTGDARRILDVCRHALTCAILRKQTQVSAGIVDEVGSEKIDFQRLEYISTCGPCHLLALKSILIEENLKEEEDIKLVAIFKRINYLIRNSAVLGARPLCSEEILRTVDDLAACGLIYLEKEKPFLDKRVYFKDPSDVFRDLIKSQRLPVD